jgi:hypothetical protein
LQVWVSGATRPSSGGVPTVREVLLFEESALDYGRVVANRAPLSLLARAWERATRDEAFLAAPSTDWLVCVVDSGGQETTWIEHRPSEENADDARAGTSRNPLNIPKRVARHIIEADATEVAIALRATYRSTLSGRIDWLGVLAVNDADDVGFQARLEPNDSAWHLGPRGDWPAPDRIPFEQLELAQLLDPLRDSILHLVTHALRDATKQRRRAQRRSRADRR